MKIGSNYSGKGRCEFVVWAPFLHKVDLKIVSPRERVLPLKKDKKGYWGTAVKEVPPGSLYFYSLDGKKDRPDPASHFQPEGVHGHSQVIDHGSFKWEDGDWRGIPLTEMIMYELHVGTFTPEGTLDAVTEGIREKILDSSENIWNGPGALLPARLTQGQTITVRSQSLVLYMKEKI